MALRVNFADKNKYRPKTLSMMKRLITKFPAYFGSLMTKQREMRMI